MNSFDLRDSNIECNSWRATKQSTKYSERWHRHFYLLYYSCRMRCACASASDSTRTSVCILVCRFCVCVIQITKSMSIWLLLLLFLLTYSLSSAGLSFDALRYSIILFVHFILPYSFYLFSPFFSYIDSFSAEFFLFTSATFRFFLFFFFCRELMLERLLLAY